MTIKELREIASKLPNTHDTKYNEGKEAEYFIMCENLSQGNWYD